MKTGNGVPVVDLFAGAGGLALGCDMAGGDVRVSVELCPKACETIQLNFDHKVLNQDVRELDGKSLRREAKLTKSDPLVLVGGPPCQPFSKNAYWTDSGADSKYRQARRRGEEAEKPKPIVKPRPDQRRSLLDEYLRLVEESGADAFLFENVPSILHPRNRKTFDSFCNDATKLGFQLSHTTVVATDFGVAQKRKRVIVIGSKAGKIEIPEPTHCCEEDQQDLFCRQRTPTAGEVIRPFRYKKYFEQQEVVTGRWADELREIPPGSNYKALTEWAGHPKPRFVAETRFWQFLLKLSPDRPSWTIAASPGTWTGPFHWDSRRLRTTELAALQGFPKDYQFHGSRREKVRQIGNAVPPPLAQAVFSSISSAPCTKSEA